MTDEGEQGVAVHTVDGFVDILFVEPIGWQFPMYVVYCTLGGLAFAFAVVSCIGRDGFVHDVGIFPVVVVLGAEDDFHGFVLITFKQLFHQF